MTSRAKRIAGFTLVEVLLVLAILGIISTIAIPSFMGQRRRARVIGDAQTNARILAMALESRRADNGIYGIAGTYLWKSDGTRPSTDLAPTFTPKGSSQMNYSVTVGGTGITYTMTVVDAAMGGAEVMTLDQSGKVTLDLAYNK